MQAEKIYRGTWLLSAFLIAFWSSSLSAFGQLHPGVSNTYAPPNGTDIANLLRSIDQADRIEVFNMNGLSVGNRVYISESPNDVATLRTCLRHIVPSTLCACSPSTIVRLYRRRKQLGQIEIMLGDIIFFSGWTGDGRISDTQQWFDWLDARGITLPRKEFEAEQPTAQAKRKKP